MKVKLVYNETKKGNFRVYEVSEPIKKGVSDIIGETNTDKIIESYRNQLNEKYKDYVLERLGKGVKYVAISDAHTHIERLAFPAFKFGETYGFLCDDIAGKHTYLTEGGDPDSVYEDAVYLRFLAKINGLKWEGLE
jgi:hypothetical protein